MMQEVGKKIEKKYHLFQKNQVKIKFQFKI